MKKIVFSFMAVALASCSMVPGYARPEVAFGNSWGGTPAGVELSEAQVKAQWWRDFGSEELNGLVAKALAGNQTLVASAERVTQARGTLRQAGASLLPGVSAGYANKYSRADVGSGRGNSSSSADVTASYEVDLFGANRASRSAAKAALEAAGYDKDAMALTVAGDVAQTYVTLLSVTERRALAEESLKASQDILKLIELRLQVGTIGLAEAAQQRSAVASAESNLASLKETEAVTRHALGILVGMAPQDFAVSGTSLAGLSVPKVPLNAPATLLERRPDLKVAEANLKAANADIGAARAAFFPTTTLSAGLLQAFDPATTGLALGASVLAPIFSGGAKTGALQTANARQREVAANYRQAVLTAFGEAADALATMESAESRLQSQTVAAESGDTALRLARLQLNAGTVDMPTLLSTQASQLSAQDGLVQAKADALKAAVQVVRAMGGGVE